ncbi:hypothetical protein FOZ62_000692 [Perkinsus olseni]|uniref:Uncharacterized protein n=1 Tax=Perkinsus olseni TaxID=32597 RepID=A0A7J6U0P1_PEROL|nr:hypothetical protein FOZ62_000692 [Perkinsus olseni]
MPPATAESELDWSSITLEPPTRPAAAGSELDWSSITLEPPSHPVTAGSELDWSSVTLEGPGDPSDLLKEEGRLPTPIETSEYPARLLGILLAVVVLGLCFNIAQIILLKKLLDRASPPAAEQGMDIEEGNEQATPPSLVATDSPFS